jgi:hypothetical protein
MGYGWDMGKNHGDLDSYVWSGYDINDTRTLMSTCDEAMFYQNYLENAPTPMVLLRVPFAIAN